MNCAAPRSPIFLLLPRRTLPPRRTRFLSIRLPPPASTSSRAAPKATTAIVSRRCSACPAATSRRTSKAASSQRPRLERHRLQDERRRRRHVVAAARRVFELDRERPRHHRQPVAGRHQRRRRPSLLPQQQAGDDAALGGRDPVGRRADGRHGAGARCQLERPCRLDRHRPAAGPRPPVVRRRLAERIVIQANYRGSGTAADVGFAILSDDGGDTWRPSAGIVPACNEAVAPAQNGRHPHRRRPPLERGRQLVAADLVVLWAARKRLAVRGLGGARVSRAARLLEQLRRGSRRREWLRSLQSDRVVERRLRRDVGGIAQVDDDPTVAGAYSALLALNASHVLLVYERGGSKTIAAHRAAAVVPVAHTFYVTRRDAHNVDRRRRHLGGLADAQPSCWRSRTTPRCSRRGPRSTASRCIGGCDRAADVRSSPSPCSRRAEPEGCRGGRRCGTESLGRRRPSSVIRVHRSTTSSAQSPTRARRTGHRAGIAQVDDDPTGNMWTSGLRRTGDSEGSARD